MPKFKLIADVEGKVAMYGGNTVETGGTFELDEGHLASKARNNPYLEEVKRGPKKKVEAE